MKKKLKRFRVHYLPNEFFYTDQAASISVLAENEELAAQYFREFSSDRILMVERVQWIACFRWLPTPFYLDAEGELTPYLEFAHLFDTQKLSSMQKQYLCEQDLVWLSPHQLLLAGEFRVGQAILACDPNSNKKPFLGAIKDCYIDTDGKRYFVVESHLGETIKVSRECLLPCPPEDLEAANRQAIHDWQIMAAQQTRKQAAGF